MPTFLPTTPAELLEQYGVSQPDFVYVSGDAYVDHPSFGAAIITRVLEDAGFTVAILPQPRWNEGAREDFTRFGKPRLAFLASSGNIDSMVAHYTAAKKRRGEDYYSPGMKPGLRPDRATIVYCNKIREFYGDVPILIGGLEASLRRMAHYDYWQNAVRRSILVDSRADILMYGMGEKSIVELAKMLDKGVPVKKIRGVRGTAYLTKTPETAADVPTELRKFGCESGFDEFGLPNGYTYDELKSSKETYAKAFAAQYYANDSVNGKAVVEYYDGKMLVVNPPQPPLERDELDHVYALPYARDYHPMYEKDGGVPAIKEVKFSITHNRGCFGGCSFCAIAFHQGRAVRSRSIESCVREAELIAAMPDFKGYIHDVGGPTANFRNPACEKQIKYGVCPNKRCLFPTPCKNLVADHSDYIKLLEAVESVKGVKKVFIRSGIRFDYVMADKSDAFFRKLVRDHVSGQLKVAPEHIAPNTLKRMGKPPVEVYEKFREKFFKLSEECGKEQYLVPYLMSSHPGTTMDDAACLALYTKKIGLDPEQVQDFYPTPGTASTVMYYTGIDPFTGEQVRTATDYNEKQLQRALLQWRRHENLPKIRAAMRYCTDIGKYYLTELLGSEQHGGNNKEKTGNDNRGAKSRDGREKNKYAKNSAEPKKKNADKRYPDSRAGDNKGCTAKGSRNVNKAHSAQSAHSAKNKKNARNTNNGKK